MVFSAQDFAGDRLSHAAIDHFLRCRPGRVFDGEGTAEFASKRHPDIGRRYGLWRSRLLRLSRHSHAEYRFASTWRRSPDEFLFQRPRMHADANGPDDWQVSTSG